MNIVLSLEGVSKRIGSRWIVRDLNMSVKPGEVYGFLGPNGAGKTTTIRMIVGLIRPTQGTVKIGGCDVQHNRKQALAQVGAIVENPETYGYLTGRQNLVQYARLAGIDNRERRIEEVIEIVRLKDRIDDKVRRYSLGMRQRLGVAQALLAKPRLLVLDEPTNGLDPAGMKEFRELMRRLADEGMSVFVSSHLLSELEQMCDRVAILKNGSVITEQTMKELVSGTLHGISLRVGQTADALRALNNSGWTATSVDENRISVAVNDDVVPRIIRDLVAADVDVFAVEPMKESLEDTFLELTGTAPDSVEMRNAEGDTIHA